MSPSPRRAVVLLITLGFIAMITALVLYQVTLSKETFDQVAQIEAENQFNVAFADMTGLIRTLRTNKELNDSEKLSILLDDFTLPPLTEPKSGLTIGFETRSYMNRLNINAMLQRLIDAERSDASQEPEEIGTIMAVLQRFFARFELADFRQLLDLMMDTVDRDDSERSPYSEIASDRKGFMQGRIYSFRHFKKIMDRYYRLTHDPNVYKITREAFETYFYFGDPASMGMLDCERLEPEVAALLDPQVEEGVDYCRYFGLIHPKMAKLFLMDTYGHYQNIEKNATKRKYLIKCTMTLETAYAKKALSFDYEFVHSGISNIEKNIHP